MSNRIVINVYDEDRDTGSQKLIYTDVVITSLSASEVVDYFKVSEGFSAQVIEGQVLSFVDFSCITLSTEDIINKAKELPLMDENPVIVLPSWCTIHIKSETNEELLTRSAAELVYTYSRFECGASGFEAMVLWASNHPWLMVFIGGVIWDISKSIIVSAFKIIRKMFGIKANKEYARRRKKLVPFDSRKFYDNFSKMINIDKSDCQIVNLNRIRTNYLEVNVRTTFYEYYEVKCTSRGNIISLNMIEV